MWATVPTSWRLNVQMSIGEMRFTPRGDVPKRSLVVSGLRRSGVGLSGAPTPEEWKLGSLSCR